MLRITALLCQTYVDCATPESVPMNPRARTFVLAPPLGVTCSEASAPPSGAAIQAALAAAQDWRPDP